MLRLVLLTAAVVVPPAAGVFAYRAGASLTLAIIFFLLAALAVWLAAQAPTDEAKAAELGRGVVVSVILTIAVTWIGQQGDERAARDSLALTLSSGQNFAGIDLHGRDLAGFFIANKNFSGADLSEADLAGAVLRETKFGGADLSNSNLSQADLRNRELNGSGTRLTGARMREAILIRTSLVAAQLAGTDLSRADLTGAMMFGADLRNADLRGAVLIGCRPWARPADRCRSARDDLLG